MSAQRSIPRYLRTILKELQIKAMEEGVPKNIVRSLTHADVLLRLEQYPSAAGELQYARAQMCLRFARDESWVAKIHALVRGEAL